MTKTGSPEAFFDASCEAFLAARRLAGGVETYYRIAGRTICVCSAGDVVLPCVTSALEHLTVEATENPSLTIRIWDDASTGAKMPSFPWAEEEYGETGGIRTHNAGRTKASYNIESRVLSMLDTVENEAIWWTQDVTQIPQFEIGSPFITLLHWWLEEQDLQLVHAGAVGVPTKGLLLVGRGGSGKSTTALSCLFSDLGYLSDDYCIVSMKSSPRADSLYSTAKLDRGHIKRLPALTSAISNPEQYDGEKALIYLNRHYPEKLITGFPVCAILLPIIMHGGETHVTPVSAGAALRALAPSTIFQLAGAGALNFKRMAEFVRSIPAYQLRLGTDLSEIPKVLAQFLEGFGEV